MITLLQTLIIVTGFLLVSSATKVIELSDRFLELRGESTWIIKFYAPWCGHCKKLEPAWNHVAQALYNTEIRVGRVDCTRFTAMASEFNIKGFPTIMFIKGDIHHVYRGDRTEEEIIGFALRMASEPVPHIDSSQVQDKIKNLKIFFLYVGERKGSLWEVYYSQALDFRHFHFFYSVDSANVKEIMEQRPNNSAVMVFKDNSHYFFEWSNESVENLPALNSSMARWINNERFPVFMKFTHGNFNQLWKLQKFLAIVVFKETKIGTLDVDTNEGNPIDGLKFRSMIETFAKSQNEKYHSSFQFGWTGSPDLANSIAMERLPLPSFVVVNTSSMAYHIPEKPSHLINQNDLETFLDSVLNESTPALGGDSYHLRAYRMYYNAKSSLEEMWAGNPVLTSVLFGLPLGFLSLICYSIWCSDILDADDDAEELEKETQHEKKE